MEIREFAEKILTTKDLTEKFFFPVGDKLTDISPRFSQTLPERPGRPYGLDFRDWNLNKKIPFPTRASLHLEKSRGQALHFFANHELLAIELMCLTLLKFPEAPRLFRLGLVKTIQEEQDHLRRYLERMSVFGVSFGEIPVNHFFWSVMQNMNSPKDYVVQMSLTFEQANLDFSRFYLEEFKVIGDLETAEHLQKVYDDEVGHVRFGLGWFDSWNDSKDSQWESYCKALPPLLSPSRAKGTIFFPEARHDVGFEENYIEELKSVLPYSPQKKKLYIFNPLFELEVERTKPGLNPDKFVSLFIEDATSIFGLLGREQDFILCSRKPSEDFLKKMISYDFTQPCYVEFKDFEDKKKKAQELIHCDLEPWGNSPEICSLRGEEWSQSNLKTLINKHFAANITKEFSRMYANDVLPHETDLPTSADSLEGVLQKISDVFSLGHQKCYLKCPFSSSGRLRKIVSAETGISENDKKWISSSLKEQGFILVQPFLDRLVDVSWNWTIGRNLQTVSPQIFLTDEEGKYKGTLLGKSFAFLPSEIKYLFFRDQEAIPSVQKLMISFIELLSRKCENDLHYKGRIGIDGFFYRAKNNIKFYPCTDINPRYTMGVVAAHLEKQVMPGRPALFMQMSHKEIQKIGRSSFVEFDEFFSQKFPMQINKNLPGKKKIESGFISLNDSSIANKILFILVVGEEVVSYFRKCFE